MRGESDPLSVFVRSEVVFNGKGFEDAKEPAKKLLGLLSGTKFRVWDADRAPVVEILEPGRDLLPAESELLKPSHVAVFVGRGEAFSAFSNKGGTYQLSEGQVDYDTMLATFEGSTSFTVIDG